MTSPCSPVLAPVSDATGTCKVPATPKIVNLSYSLNPVNSRHLPLHKRKHHLARMCEPERAQYRMMPLDNDGQLNGLNLLQEMEAYRKYPRCINLISDNVL